MISPELIREQFPFFAQHPDIVYLDSAATTQKPYTVIKTIRQFYEYENANASRGVYPLGSELTSRVDGVRKQIAGFIGCDTDEVFFTSGATAAYDMFARLTEHMFQDGDSIVYSSYDHRSFVRPLQRISGRLKENGIKVTLRDCKTTDVGDVDRADLKEKIDATTRLIALSRVHNIFGAGTEPRDIPNNTNAIVVMDVAQGVSCGLVDMGKMPHVDVIAFSGHKLFAAQGIGVLVIRKSLHEQLLHSPEIVKGDTLRETIEAGTQNWAGVVSLAPAMNFMERLGLDLIHERQALCTQRIVHALRDMPGIIFTPGPAYWTCHDGYGIVSFSVEGVSSVDVGFALAQQGVYVRTGTHCSTTSDARTDSVRISTHVYTTDDDIDRVIAAIKVIAEMAAG